MALKPNLKTKIDELFLSWLSEPETQTMLKTNLRLLLKGEPMTRAPPAFHSMVNKKPGNSIHMKQQSPRLRPSSPQAPPCSPSIASPRSPRPRAVKSPQFPNQANHKTSTNRDVVTAEKKDSPFVDNRGVQETEPSESAFLQQKRDELNQKRLVTKEKDLMSSQQPLSEKATGDSTFTVVTTPPPEDSSRPNLEKTVARNNKELFKKPEVIFTSDDRSEPTVVVPPKNVIQRTKPNGFKNQPVPSPSDAASLPTSAAASLEIVASSDVALQRASANTKIPQFYFPMGCPSESGGNEAVLQRVKEEFDKVEGGNVTKTQIGSIVKACGIPFYWKSSFFRYLGGEKMGHIMLQGFLTSWKKLSSTCYDSAARFVCITAKPGRNYLEFDDFLPILQDVVDSHPGLKFLQDAPEFHSRYIQTVISRIFYCINRSWTGRITAQEMRKSNLLSTIELLEEEEDINQIMDFFSYEHFYVIYCKFWELDTDHDLLISKEDLCRHNDHAISSRMIDRIFSGAVTKNLTDGKLSYKDFVWFLISEEDKKHPRSVEYWFRCMDLDGDGIISMYEMEYFYEEQVQKMEMLGIETLPFHDCLCQMLDMIHPEEDGKIRLKDLKACSLTPVFFDTFFNLDKYLEHEQKDPFASLRDRDGEETEMSDWERFAAEEYEQLVAEEGIQQQEDEMIYEDDFEPDDAEAEVDDANKNVMQMKKTGSMRDASQKKEDIYDFSSNDLGY